MDFILVIGVIVFLYIAISHSATKAIDIKEKLIIEKKQCPPHQWFWQEIVDQNGEKQGERMVCKICGPLSNLLNGDKS